MTQLLQSNIVYRKKYILCHRHRAPHLIVGEVYERGEAPGAGCEEDGEGGHGVTQPPRRAQVGQRRGQRAEVTSPHAALPVAEAAVVGRPGPRHNIEAAASH